MNKKSKIKGFTLIELLVVIAIIGLLSSVVMASLNNARTKARDSRRIADIKEIQKALEFYYNDNGKYPYDDNMQHALSFDTTCGGTPNCGHCNRWCTMDTVLSPYLSKVPRDPNGSSQSSYYYGYYSNSADNFQTYGLGTVLENPSSISQNDGGFYDNMYEIGQRPSYCKQKYNKSWLWREGGGTWQAVCDGGN